MSRCGILAHFSCVADQENDLPFGLYERLITRITPGQFDQHHDGTYRDQATNSGLFFVTLEKSERDYSPSTLYKDRTA